MNFHMQSNLSNTPQDPLYRRVQFLWALLWVMLITFLILGAFNYALNDIRWIAHMHWTTSILSVVLIYWHWQRPQAKVLAEKIRHAVAAFIFYDDIRITVSLGVASFQPDDDESSLMRRADKALYAAKANGRNCTITEAELTQLAPN